MLDPEFYVGRLGDLVALPGTPNAVGLPAQLIGGTHLSLGGGFTQDVFGVKRSWLFSWPGLTARQTTYLRALRAGRVRGPLFLLDPREPNRLPTDVAGGGSDTGSPVAWRSTNNAVTRWTSLDDVATGSHDTLLGHRVLAGAIEWELFEGVSSSLEVADPGPRSTGRLTVPCLPGEPLELTGQFLGPPDAQVAMVAQVVDARRQTVATFAGEPLLLDPTVWRRPVVPFTTPGDGAGVRVSAQLSPAYSDPGGGGFGDGSPGGLPVSQSVAESEPIPGVRWTTGWSLHRTDDPEVWPYLFDHCAEAEGDLTDGFRLGGGVAQVVPTAPADAAYTVPGLTSTALVLTER